MGDAIEWYEASAAGVDEWSVDLETGDWRERKGSRGRLDAETLAAVIRLARLVRPEHSQGGPHLSSLGPQRLTVTIAGQRVRVDGSASESISPEVDAVVAAVASALLAAR